MRLLGIDYGTKKVGIALSDEAGRFATPYAVLPNDANLLDKLTQICLREKVGKIIVGQSLDYRGQPNPVLAPSEILAKKLAQATSLSLDWQEEFLTSREAERVIGRDEQIDARAAAIILRSYIDKQTYVVPPEGIEPPSAA